jgi:methylmalonyl-CoA mutase
MNQNNKPGLFEEFPGISTQEWEEKILQDLKGADYEKKLVWKTVEGLSIKPYYRSEDLTNLKHIHSLPGEYPYVRGKKASDNNWDIREDLDESDPSLANEEARKAISRGAEAIGFTAEKITGRDELKILLSGIDPSQNAVHFLHSSNYKPLFRDFTALAKELSWPTEEVKGSLNFDPLGFYLLYGKFYGSAKENYRDALELIRYGEGFKKFRLITVNAQHYHNAGAHNVQEIAFALSQANEYLAALTDEGANVDEIAPKMQFTMAVGSNYFLEIAKLRAIKMLWAKIVEQYQPQKEESMKINLHAVTSNWNKSIYDPYVNLLRTTTETMAAAIAGVDSITVDPFDHTYKKSDPFSSRIARNQQIVLKHESYFNKVADPAAGSYYVENITDSIADAAWNLFVEMEKDGSFIKAAEKGFIKEEIAKTCQKRDMDIAMRKQVFVGVNQYPNLQEKMLDKIKPTAKLHDLGELQPYRGTQAFEALRLATENHVAKGFPQPKVYLFTYGNLAMRKARATFATNFFGVAGYQIQEAPMVKDLDTGIEKALEAQAQIVVFCSSDDEYAEMIGAAQKIHQQQPQAEIVVAGNPASIADQLNQAGVKHYIHLKTNALYKLQEFNLLLGIV